MNDLGDIGGVVADPLEVLGDKQHVGAGGDRARIAHHVGQQFAEQAVVVLVHLVVARPDGERPVEIGRGIGVQHILQAAQNQLPHPLYGAGERGQWLGLGQHQGALGDVLGQVAAALQIHGDLHRRHGLAQVIGHRLAQGDQADRLALDVGLQDVQPLVAADH